MREPGPVERELRALWPEARRRLWRQPRYWWRALRLVRLYDLRPVKLARLQLRVPARVVPDCEACEEVCCTGRHRVVSLRLTDVAAFIDAGLTEHIVFERPDYSIDELDRSVALAEHIHSDLWQWFPVLRQDHTGTCTLLDEDLRCRAHPAWPLSCARFPYSLNRLEGTIFFAGSCRYHRLIPAEESTGQVRELIEATVESYNQRIRDLVLVHVAQDRLAQLGLLPYLRLPRRLRDR